MKYGLLLSFVLLSCLCSVSALQTDSKDAKYHLNQGVQDYKQANYQSAIEHFKQAHRLDPQSSLAALYLATALTQTYVPGVDEAENVKIGDEAIGVYKELLVIDPGNITALKGLAYLAMNMKKFDEAKSYYWQVTQQDPNDPEGFYSVGVVDWTQSYKRRADERSKRGLSMNGPPSPTQSFCPQLRTDNLPLIEEGMAMLVKAIELRPNYDDAMAYLSLLYRERSEIQCGDKAARKQDERWANQWVDKAMQIRKRKFEDSKGVQPLQNQ